MKRFNVILAVTLLIATGLTEAHSIIRVLNPATESIQVNWFWKAGFDYAISILWMIKMMADEFLLIVTYFMMAYIALRFSLKTFLIISCFFFYWVVDNFLFYYNYKQTYWVFWTLLILLVFVVTLLLIPFKERGKFISLR